MYDLDNEQRISNGELRELCVKNGWFRCGTSEQYEKLFYMNEHGAPIEQIATVIWLCSDSSVPDNCRRDILVSLHEAGFTARDRVSEKEHLADWLGI